MKRLWPYALAFAIIAVGELCFWYWRHGVIVARAEFDPGIAPFSLSVRRVPVPVTASNHFIVDLHRGEYVVSSFRYFWGGYTPQVVRISWPCINHFSVFFDEQYEATCDWEWGKNAIWSMKSLGGTVEPGLSAYYFTPQKPVPQGCPQLAH